MSIKITRDMSDRVLAGVCSGLARHLNIPSLAVRLLFVVGATFGLGTGAIFYCLLWFLMPKD